MWNFRLMTLTAEARYGDVLERTLYNGVNAGMSLSGTTYCYRDPLASNGEKLRNPWYDTTCCPPNIERLFESLPGYFYAMSRDGVYVNLYNSSELNWHLEDGLKLKLRQTTNYPWSGEIRLTVVPEHAAQFGIYLRWPGWAQSADVQVNGHSIDISPARPGSYISVLRKWAPGDVIVLTLPMQAVPMAANPRVASDYGRVAIKRGPLVYSLEQMDQNGAALGDLFVKTSSTAVLEQRKDLLGGITVLKVPGLVAERSLGDELLYQPLTSMVMLAKRPVTLTFIPYYAFANREPTPMEVWVPLSRLGDPSYVSSAPVAERRQEPK